MPAVSIIVPIYKTERYLARCVDSLLAQTLADIEIILVDDGSPDTCPALCDAYAEKDARIRVVHKENGGLSSARNAGMDVATGDYIGFVDSDDSVHKTMFEVLYTAAERDGAEVTMCDYTRVLADGTQYPESTALEGGCYRGEALKNAFFPSLILGLDLNYGPMLSVWHCLYRRDFLIKHGLRFVKEVKWSEDNLFSAFVGYYMSSFTYCKDEALYYYYQNPGTITTAYRPGAFAVYSEMNRRLAAFFTDKENGYFLPQLHCHLVFYACVCLSQTAMLEGEACRKAIGALLDDATLQDALRQMPKKQLSLKLRVQLLLMQAKAARLLAFILKRRQKI